MPSGYEPIYGSAFESDVLFGLGGPLASNSGAGFILLFPEALYLSAPSRMIYLDTTSAATSSMNMGAQRMIRGIYARLSELCEVTPLCWDYYLKRYTRLSSREVGLLTKPFSSYRGSVRWPEFSDGTGSIGAVSDWMTRWRRHLPLSEILSPGATLLIPDICWDPRVLEWEGFGTWPGRKIAIFHDAMPLKIKGEIENPIWLFEAYVEALAQMDLVICVSKETEADLIHFWRKMGISEKPTTVVPWPVPFEEVRPENAQNFSSKNILYVSRLKLRKNHLVLFEACEILWKEGLDFSLSLIGTADGLIDTFRIENVLRRLKREGYPVKWLGHISNFELKAAYRDSSFTVFPSQMEGFGLPILESLWCRRPVVCGTNGALGETSRDGGCYPIDQNDPTSLANAMRDLLTDQRVYEELYAQADRRKFRFWNDYTSDLLNLLHPIH